MAGRDVSTARAFMTADLPAWIPADPGTLPALPQVEGREGRVVVLLSTEGALADGWAGSVAVDLVAGWSQAGARVVVADAGLSTPLLHEALGLPNHEGLADALRWGASVRRIVQRPEGRRFLALTAGTAVADSGAVLGLPRWKALCSGFREAGVTLAVLVPSWEEGLKAVLEEADGLVVLAAPDEDLRPVLVGVEKPVLAVVGRFGADVPEAVADEAAAERSLEGATGAPQEDEAAEGLPQVEDVWAAAPVEPMAEPAFDPIDDPAMADAEPAFDPIDDPAMTEEEPDGASSWGSLANDGAPPFLAPEEDSEEATDLSAWDEGEPESDAGPTETDDPADVGGDWAPVALPASEPDDEDEFVLPEPIPVPPSLEEIVEESEAAPRRGRSGMLLLLLVVVAVSVAVAGWLGYLDIPGITPTQSTASSPPAPVVAAPMPPTEVSQAQPYSLALGAYQDGVVAGERVSTLAGQVPGVLFQSVPVEVDGTLYYRVLAGPAADSAAVLALASHIADAAEIDPTPWVPRWTPLAFQLGEMPDREAADRRVGALNGLGVSAYVLAVAYSDGSVRYRVLAGAFADAAEASYLSGLLDERGLSSANLSDRTGRLPE